MDDAYDFLVTFPDPGGQKAEGMLQNIGGRALNRSVGQIGQTCVRGKQELASCERPAFQGDGSLLSHGATS